ncbi:MAG: tRNA glutamyl-Q(34) synthetase GluQRS [SAR86 cluster bacterium]|jgi:glutamyl-Q tRNA(Asp) synthetase|tara:strand:+ start:5134 stop:6018 length:885 start_codon:yes stop_codon:yes gene_type:complete
MSQTQRYIGRFAPSPTGPLHFGSIVVALAGWLEARQNQGLWLLRIEDLDPPRERPDATAQIMSQLESLGLHWNGTPLFQSQRLDAYQTALDTLKDQLEVYPCTCSRRDLPPIYPGTCRSRPFAPSIPAHSIRFRVPPAVVAIDDRIQGRLIAKLPLDVGDFIIKRKDGYIAYQLAVTVDDAYQNISHVIRGSDLLDSSPKQACLGAALRYPPVNYAHIPLLVDRQGLKLSKSSQAAAIPGGEPIACIRQALSALGQPLFAEIDDLESLLQAASQAWSIDLVPQRLTLAAPADQY